MNRSPLLLSCTLVASLSVANIGSAWSAPATQENIKPTKSTTPKAQTYKAKKSSSSLKNTRTAAVSTMKISREISEPVQVVKLPAPVTVTANPYLSTPGITVPSYTAPSVATLAAAIPAAAIPVIEKPVAVAVPVAIIEAVQPTVVQPVVAQVSAPPAIQPVVQPDKSPAAPGPVVQVAPAKSNNPYMNFSYSPQAQPTLTLPTLSPNNAANSPQKAPLTTNHSAPVAPAQTPNSLNFIFADLKSLLPSLTLPGDVTTILPVIKTVYPTGEKPLVVINFKCPTEVIGITPPPMKALHELLNFGFDGLNKTNLLSFNLQQVCS